MSCKTELESFISANFEFQFHFQEKHRFAIPNIPHPFPRKPWHFSLIIQTPIINSQHLLCRLSLMTSTTHMTWFHSSLEGTNRYTNLSSNPPYVIILLNRKRKLYQHQVYILARVAIRSSSIHKHVIQKKNKDAKQQQRRFTMPPSKECAAAKRRRKKFIHDMDRHRKWINN